MCTFLFSEEIFQRALNFLLFHVESHGFQNCYKDKDDDDYDDDDDDDDDNVGDDDEDDDYGDDNDNGEENNNGIMWLAI